MRFTTRNLFLISILTLLSLCRASAAFEAFLKIDGVVGDSLDRYHPGEIIVSSFSTGLTGGPASTSGTGAGKPTFQELTVVKTLDKSSPILMLKCAQGTHFPKAVLSLRKPGTTPFEFYQISLTNVLITSDSTKGDSTNLVTETVTLSFRAVQWSYTTQKADGSADTPVVGSWNLDTNAP